MGPLNQPIGGVQVGGLILEEHPELVGIRPSTRRLGRQISAQTKAALAAGKACGIPI